MAIGDRVQAGLMRVDSSPILLAGQAQAQANQAFGNAVGGVVEKFYQKKKDKQERDEREQAYLKMGLTSEEAKAASRDKDLANQFINKMNADRNFNLQMLQFKDNEAYNAARIASLGDQSMDRFAEMEMKKEDRKRLLEKAEELKKSQLKLDRFLTQRPKTETTEFSNLQKQFTLDQIPGTPEFEAKELSEPMGARPPLMASVATDKPNFKMFNVGKSEAVARLPESFQPQGVRVIDAVESGRLTPREGMGLINQIQAQAMAEQKAAPTAKDILDMQAKMQDMDIKGSDYGDSESIKTFTPKSNYLQLGTTKMPISGRLGNEAEAIKYKDEYIPAFNQTNAAFEKLLALGQKRADGWYMSSEDKDQALSYIKTLQGNIRVDILGPGTVQESERVILDNIVKDPTKAFTLNGAAANMEILRNLRQTIFDRLENRLGNFGLKLGDSKSPNSTQAKPDYTDETSTGNKIRTFDFDNPNQ